VGQVMVVQFKFGHTALDQVILIDIGQTLGRGFVGAVASVRINLGLICWAVLAVEGPPE